MSFVIRSQGVRFSLINYIGVLIGAMSILFVYPLDLKLYGLYGFLTNTASLLAPLVSLGFGAVLLRFFPYYRNESQQTNSRFILFLIKGYALGIILFVFLFILFKEHIARLFNENDNYLQHYIYYLIPLTVLYIIYEFISHFSVTHKNIVLPSILSNLFKIILPILFIICIHNYLSTNGFLICIFIYYLLIIFILLKVLSRKENINFSLEKIPLPKNRKKEMWTYALYSIISGTSAVMALRIDSLMIASQIGSEATGLFSIALFMSNATFIPALSLQEILSPFVSQSSKTDDKVILQSLYSKSVRNMLIPTLWASMCLYLSFGSISSLFPNAEKIILIKTGLGLLLLSRIVDAATGINHHILSFSKYYKIEIYLLIGLAALNIGLNFLFIKPYGIAGAALATFISVSLFNIIKSLYIFLKLKLQPFDWRTIRIIVC
ncbi:MAG: oligosaccharide flippase family protein, partial [Saprospiraceae bacterium]